MAGADPTPLQFADFTLDPAARTLVDADGREVALRRSEYELLLAFLAAPGRALSRDHLLDAVAGRHSEPFDRSVDVLVGRLRRKIEPDSKEPRLIVTVPGVGYRFAAKPRPASAEGLATPAAPVSLPASPERRQLTVMQCGLCGPARASARRDPEDLQHLLSVFHEHATSVITEAGGTVAWLLSDGIVVYFGYPQADEHQAERAVRAALRLTEAAGRIDTGPLGRLQLCIGVATGLAVVGGQSGASGQPTALGEAASVAARVAAKAEPDAVLIAASTRRLLGELFELRACAPIAMEGVGEPVEAWQIVAEVVVESRFEALRGAALAPLVGREEELELLLRRWEQAKAGSGKVVLISGEPGVGKSRLARAFQDAIAAQPHIELRLFCSPHHQNSALHPFIAQLQHAAGFARDDTDEARLAKLDGVLAQSNATDEAVALIAELLSVPTDQRERIQQMSPQARRERTLAALLAQLTGLASRQPVFVIYEDVHWIDPTSLELLSLSIQRIQHCPVLILLTARPAFKPPWPEEAHVTTHALARLDRVEAAALIDGVTGSKALPADVMEQILTRTDGVPLFIEELTKAVLESGVLRETDDRYALAGPLPPFAIPVTLRDSFMARLDRIATARDVVQTGAALGREFSYDMLRAVVALPNDLLDEALRDLVRSELLFCRGLPPQAVYKFKHALTQDAAYQSMLKSRRAHLHKRIAEVLEHSFPELVQTEPETLARHFTAAACVQPAIRYWLSAGQHARQRSAHQEAIRHFSAGIALLSDLPEQAARMRLEVDLQAALGFTLIIAKGYAAPEVEAAFSRAYELWQTIGETSLAIPVLRGFTTFHWVRGNLPVAKRFGLKLAEIAERTSDDELSSVLHGMLGGILCYMGEISQSETWFGKLRAAYDHQKRRDIVIRFGEDTPSTTWCFHGFNLAWMGQVDAALAAIRDAVASARRTGHPYSMANALCRAAVCHVILRDPVRAASFAGQCVAIAREIGFPIPLAMSTIVLGWASALDSKTREGLNQIHDGIASWRSTGARIALPFYCALLSEAMLASGDIGAALASADEGWRLSMKNSEHAWDCLVRCSHGDALFASGEFAGAEADYQKALAWARERSAKWGELYAGIHLARLWRSEGRTGKARDLLAPIHKWFTGSFGVPAPIEAKALLDELRDGIEQPSAVMRRFNSALM